MIAISILQLSNAVHNHDGTWKKAIGQYPASIILSVYAFLASWFVGGLTAFHSLLISRNTTTYEHFRSRYLSSGNPYDLGFFRNWKEVLFSRVPPRHGQLWASQKEKLGIDSSNDEGDVELGVSDMRAGVDMGGSLPPSVDGSSDAGVQSEATVCMTASQDDYAHVLSTSSSASRTHDKRSLDVTVSALQGEKAESGLQGLQSPRWGH